MNTEILHVHRMTQHINWALMRLPLVSVVPSMLWLAEGFTNIAIVLSGSGIGTGPGVIQDRYSPTMGRHRTNPLFNGHSGHIAPQPQSQFDVGAKSFVKSNQVSLTCPCRRCRVQRMKALIILIPMCSAKGSEPAFSQPEPEPHGPATGPVQGHASTIQQERTAQCRRGNCIKMYQLKGCSVVLSGL